MILGRFDWSRKNCKLNILLIFCCFKILVIIELLFKVEVIVIEFRIIGMKKIVWIIVWFLNFMFNNIVINKLKINKIGILNVILDIVLIILILKFVDVEVFMCLLNVNK